ncbi:MAG: radical SAM protein [Spirochaetaceae bacterium]|nr:radical SAM protein [Spirochaetaceae bacterium]
MNKETHVVIIQPPLVQLNTPYPSGAYLKSFFQRIKSDYPEFYIGQVKWLDLSIMLFHSIFSVQGLKHIFSATEEKALEQATLSEKIGQTNEAFNLRRYISQQEAWIKWIEPIKQILSASSRELCHEFVSSPAIPRGQRMESYLQELEREVDSDDARILASLALADLADYICVMFDSAFTLIRYGESIATSITDFNQVESMINSPILKKFYEPLLEKILNELPQEGNLLICITCPFPGTLAASLFTGRKAKEKFGCRAKIIMGGGYVNTELRELKNSALSQYIDGLSFDRGYGSYLNLFTQLCQNSNQQDTKIYKLRQFFPKNIIDCSSTESNSNWAKKEDYYTSCVFPDYSEIDFSLYPRLLDSRNPMHRLWSDGAWIKAYLAHGCYWHRCAFCDTTLDYVYAYRKTQIKALHEHLWQQAEQQKIFGIHLVDEAAPPVALADFALCNLKKNHPLSFWGNIRYEKSFSRDLADLLAHSGMTGVSGGIEIANSRGLDAISKGTDLDSIIAACAAFKEAGILTHAYMIYGYWLETPQILSDSMETLRQLFLAGLIDSAFWHKFVLTKHSTVYAQYKKGFFQELKPFDSTTGGVFACNDLHFAEEKKSNRYSFGLQQSVAAWMARKELNRSVNTWFDFPFPKPSVPKDFVDKAITKYEEKRNAAFKDFENFKNTKGYSYIWLGGKPFVTTKCCGNTNKLQICWNYMGELLFNNLEPNTDLTTAKKIALSLFNMKADSQEELLSTSAEFLFNNLTEKMYHGFRGKGLCRIR